MASGYNAPYSYSQGFDQVKLQEGVFSFLPKHQPGYAPTAAECAVKLINRLGRDACVTDLRFMAHMLATACHEAPTNSQHPLYITFHNTRGLVNEFGLSRYRE